MTVLTVTSQGLGVRAENAGFSWRSSRQRTDPATDRSRGAGGCKRKGEASGAETFLPPSPSRPRMPVGAECASAVSVQFFPNQGVAPISIRGHSHWARGGTTMDATRTRRTRDPARQTWYASHRQRRFARFLGFLSLRGPDPERIPSPCPAIPTRRREY
jgi:hypothetical protein